MSSTAKIRAPSLRTASASLRTSRSLSPSLQSRPSPSRRAFLKTTASALLLPALGSPLLTACGGGSLDTTQPETPRLASVDNFRDVAGTAAGYPTVDGKQMRRGVFYRANALTLDASDKATLEKLGIAAVYDLRTPGEIAHTPDVLPAGAISQTINVLGTSDLSMAQFATSTAAIASMEIAERAYVIGTAQRAGFGALLTQLANTQGVQLFHSNAGKDRTGWVAAVLLSIANVPLDVIMQDYLLSNVYEATAIQTMTATLRAQDGDAAALIEAPLFSVQESFLQAGFDQVQASYGTMARYLMQGLGLSQSTIDTLHGRLVV
jgi:protein-tyrosine phosphatase